MASEATISLLGFWSFFVSLESVLPSLIVSRVISMSIISLDFLSIGVSIGSLLGLLRYLVIRLVND